MSSLKVAAEAEHKAVPTVAGNRTDNVRLLAGEEETDAEDRGPDNVSNEVPAGKVDDKD